MYIYISDNLHLYFFIFIYLAWTIVQEKNKWNGNFDRPFIMLFMQCDVYIIVNHLPNTMFPAVQLHNPLSHLIISATVLLKHPSVSHRNKPTERTYTKWSEH